MTTETLNFKIGLSRSSVSKEPEFSIHVGDTEYVSGFLTKQPNEIEYFTFDAEVNEGESSITIRLKNKADSDTVKDADGNIIQDIILNVESIEVDEINLRQMLWTHSDYRPKYSLSFVSEQKKLGIKLEDSIKSCVNLGWNGDWSISFTSPFYIWLLENI
jgi:hypothetical protein